MHREAHPVSRLPDCLIGPDSAGVIPVKPFALLASGLSRAHARRPVLAAKWAGDVYFDADRNHRACQVAASPAISECLGLQW
jgi:hypothetical protein